MLRKLLSYIYHNNPLLKQTFIAIKTFLIHLLINLKDYILKKQQHRHKSIVAFYIIILIMKLTQELHHAFVLKHAPSFRQNPLSLMLLTYATNFASSRYIHTFPNCMDNLLTPVATFLHVLTNINITMPSFYFQYPSILSHLQPQLSQKNPY